MQFEFNHYLIDRSRIIKLKQGSYDLRGLAATVVILAKKSETHARELDSGKDFRTRCII